MQVMFMQKTALGSLLHKSGLIKFMEFFYMTFVIF